MMKMETATAARAPPVRMPTVLLALEGVLEMLSDEGDVTLLMLLPSGGEGGGGYGSQERASGGAACGPVAEEEGFGEG